MSSSNVCTKSRFAGLSSTHSTRGARLDSGSPGSLRVRARADQVGEGAAKLAGACRLGLQLAVGVGHRLVEQHLFRGWAQHQHFATQAFQVPKMLVEAFGRDVVGGDAEHRQVDGLLGLMGTGDAVGQVFQAIERRDFQAAVFQLML